MPGRVPSAHASRSEVRRPARHCRVLIADLRSAVHAPASPRTATAPARPHRFQAGADPTTPALPKDGRPLLPIPDVRPAGFTDPPPGEGWPVSAAAADVADCRNGLQCATVLAPLDYDHPDDAAISLALAKRPAIGTRRLGSLFINPGGPGGSGVEYAAGFNAPGSRTTTSSAGTRVGWAGRRR